ncbi:MAG: hypothetical protein KU38_05120 [Sulfurovum sp. FS08-3]|nr:MAG: hypothetical protein KU38_05120 [Sulfurovum sp. FS08-3]
MNDFEKLLSMLESDINLAIVVIIGILALIDVVFKKDLKSQIVSLGVLGTFIGIFMGLQDFNEVDIKNSVSNILVGLKTAFFTSIVAMGTALVLAIIQKTLYKNIDDENNQENLLKEISDKLNHLEKLNQTQETDKIIGELERLRIVQTDTREETKKVAVAIDELKTNSNQENQKLISILDTNFEKMNNSLEIAIEKLSKGATEEIMKALETVIKEFNQELQSSFGDNFVQLNEAVINLLKWQENYKTHIETLDEKLELSTTSIEKSKESLEVISSKNKEVLNVYGELKRIIDVYDRQIQNLTQHLQTYATLSSSAENMFATITTNISKTKEEFSDLSEHIKKENTKQLDNATEITSKIANDIKLKTTEIKSNFNDLTSSFEKNKKELELISNHFKNLGEEIPKALKVSLESLNSGLTSLTNNFQKDYKDIMDNYKNGIRQ